MTHTSTTGTIETAIGASSLAFGVLALVSPSTLRRTYGDRTLGGGSLDYFGRTWGTRTATLGALILMAGTDEERRLIARAGAAMNSLDTILGFTSTGVPVRTRIMAGVTSAAFAAGGAYVAANL